MEHLRLDGAKGISVWWRDHATPLARPLGSEGPFCNCENRVAGIPAPWSQSVHQQDGSPMYDFRVSC